MRQHGLPAQAGSAQITGFAVQPHSALGRCKRRKPLCQQTAQHARQQIAAAAARHAGIAGGVYGKLALG